MTFSDNVSISMGLDGLSYSSVKKIENKNGGVGMGTGINLNLDTNNGVLGGYQISESISKSGNSTITTQTQSGIRTGDTGQIGIAVGLLTSPIWLPPITIGTSSLVTATTSSIIILKALFDK